MSENRNSNLSRARANANDEFYTRFEDINKELQHYKSFFKDKIVYCNCDDGQWSNFWRFFYSCFEAFGLKKLVATSYHDGISHTNDAEDIAYKYEYEGGFGQTDFVANNYMEGVTVTKLEEDGDFRSEECLKFLEECDVVVTNPPFSLFREYVACLEKYNKQYIIIGPQNAITYREIFPLIKANKLWLGYNSVKEFMQPDGTIKKFGNIIWYINVDVKKRHDILECYSKYDSEKYPKYDNYDAIECNKVANIPCDYTGIIGVPITWLDKYNPDQFELIGNPNIGDVPIGWKGVSKEIVDLYYSQGNTGAIHEGWIKPMYIDENGNAIAPYNRLLIRWKTEAMPTIDEDGVICYHKGE